MAGSTLEVIKSFDFSTPVNVSIVYDDSEEDDKSVIQIVKEEVQTKNDISYLQQKVKFGTGYFMPSIDNLNDELKSGQNKRIFCQAVEEAKTKRKRDIPENNNIEDKVKNSKNNGTDGDLVNEEHNVSHFFAHKKFDSANKHKKTQNRVTDDSVTQNGSVTTKTMCRLQDESGHKEISDTSSENTQTKNEDFNKVTDYIEDILNTFSKNLILSIVAYRNHLKYIENVNGRETNPLVQESKKKFLLWKYHYYQLSYCAIGNIILPQEMKGNTTFIKDFLNKTVLFAKENMNLTYTKQDLEPFYYDMIAWAKKKQESLNEICAKTKESHVIQNVSQPLRPNAMPERNTSVTNVNSLLTAALAQPPKETELSQILLSQLPGKQQPIVQQQPNMIPIFTGGAPDREVVVSIDNAALNGIRNRSLPKKTRSSIKQQNTYHTPSLPAIPNREVNPYAQNTRVYSYIPTEAVPANNTYNSVHQYNYPGGDNTHQYYRTLNYRQKAPPPYNAQAHYIPYVQQQQTCSDYDRYHSQTAQPMHQQTMVQHTSPADPNRQNEQNQTIQYTRSSVSTDSGFASPPQFNTNADAQALPSEERQVVPLITHVTSLHPAVQHIAEGVCHVCTARTNTMCRGCLQVYYCGSTCQTIDWYVHQGSCIKQSVCSSS